MEREVFLFMLKHTGAQCVGEVVKRVGFPNGGGTAFMPDSLASEVLADPAIEFKRLCVIGYQQTGPSSVEAILQPMCIVAKDTNFPIRIADMLFCVDPPLALREKYLTETSTIALAREIPVMGSRTPQ